MKKFNKKGFTLIEMLVVIAVIAILVSIVIPTVQGSTEKAAEAADAANIRAYIAEATTKGLTGGTYSKTYTMKQSGSLDSVSEIGGYPASTFDDATSVTIEWKDGALSVTTDVTPEIVKCKVEGCDGTVTEGKCSKDATHSQA